MQSTRDSGVDLESILKARLPVAPAKQGGAFSVLVIDEETQHPLAGSIVVVNGTETLASDASGVVKLVERPSEIEAHCLGFVSKQLKLVGNEVDYIRIALGDGGKIEGSVVGPSGEPAVGLVQLVAGGVLIGSAEIRGSDGSFELRGLELGQTCELRVSAPGYIVDPFPMNAREVGPIRLVADRFLGCMVRFRDPTIAPIDVTLPEIGIVVRRPKLVPAERLRPKSLSSLAPWIPSEQLELLGPDFVLAFRTADPSLTEIPIQVLVSLPGYENVESQVQITPFDGRLEEMVIPMNSLEIAKGGLEVSLNHYLPGIKIEGRQLGSVFLKGATGWEYEFEVKKWGEPLRLNSIPLGTYQMWFETPEQFEIAPEFMSIEHSSPLTRVSIDLSRFGALRIELRNEFEKIAHVSTEFQLRSFTAGTDVSFVYISKGERMLHFVPKGEYAIKFEKGLNPDALESSSVEVTAGNVANFIVTLAGKE